MEFNGNQSGSGMAPCEIPALNMSNSLSLRLQSKNVENLLNISEKYDINPEMADRLLKLQNYELVIVCDDSGSMATSVDGSNRTRWNELCGIIKIIIDIGVLFDSNGVDIHFLNDEKFLKVKDVTTVDEAFKRLPDGYTPLVPVLEKIFTSNLARRGRDKKLLVFVATDGEPTDEDGNPMIDQLKHLMQNVRQVETTYVSFLSCTDDPTCLEYLSDWDKEMIHVDVTSDYIRESQEIRQHRGPNYSFSHGDYVVKALVGAIDREIDIIDEPQ